MLSRFFLDRPVFAWVIAIIIMTLGALAIHKMPISQYPPIAPPSISITAYYPGASAETVENTVTQIIEQKMTGLDGLLYLSGDSSSSGQARLDLTFEPGTDPDIAWSKVQNKLQLATASLPDDVQRSGVEVSKSTLNYHIGIAYLRGLSMTVTCGLRPSNKIIRPGARGEWNFAPYAIALPDRTSCTLQPPVPTTPSAAAYNVRSRRSDRERHLSGPSSTPHRVQHLLQTPEEFANIPVRINPDGSVVRIKDVGRTELGSERFDIVGEHNGLPSAAMAIRQAAGANALETADAIKSKLEEMSAYFPPGMKVVSLRHHAVHQGGHRRGGQDPVRGRGPGLSDHVPVYGQHPGHHHPDHRRARGPSGDLRGPKRLRILHQHADHVRHGAGYRAFGGRRHRGGGKRGAHHVRGGPLAREATAKSMDEITSALVGIGLVLSAVFGPMAFFRAPPGCFTASSRSRSSPPCCFRWWWP
jgi:hypothetical protein